MEFTRPRWTRLSSSEQLPKSIFCLSDSVVMVDVASCRHDDAIRRVVLTDEVDHVFARKTVDGIGITCDRPAERMPAPDRTF